MGKKKGWILAVKRVLACKVKEKPRNGSDKKKHKEKKDKKSIQKSKSFIPLFKEPSSIEKILGEADQLPYKPAASFQPPVTPPTLVEDPISPGNASPKSASHQISSPNAASPQVSSVRITSPKLHSPTIVSPTASSKTDAHEICPSDKEISYEPQKEPTTRIEHLSATKIQAVYRGYMARRSFRDLMVLVRLQELVKGQNVKRQTIGAIKQMQLLVRIQQQIQSRRMQMLENRAMQHRDDKELQRTLSQWNQLSEAGNDEDWDHSSLTKEEFEARLRQKVDAAIKRERTMAYAKSHQWRSNSKSAQNPSDILSNGYPWWSNWLERQQPLAGTLQSRDSTKNRTLTPPRPTSEYTPSPRLHNHKNKHKNSPFDDISEAHTPRSSRSSIPSRAQFHTPSRTPTPPYGRMYSKQRPRDASFKDDDSLMSCPAFSSSPNYLTPTVSARAKSRAGSNPKERFPGTPSSDTRRRSLFPSPSNGSVKSSATHKMHSTHSIGELSMDSATSKLAIVGRKPFNRFV